MNYSERAIEVLEYRIVQLRKFGLSYNRISQTLNYNRIGIVRVSKQNCVDTPPLPGHLAANKRTQKKKLKKRAEKETYICKGCGISFLRKRNRYGDEGKTYHSRECAFKHHHQWAVQDEYYGLMVKKYCAIWGISLRGGKTHPYIVGINGYYEGDSCPVSFNKCKYCGGLFTSTVSRLAKEQHTETWHSGLAKNSSMFCSKLCEYKQRLKDTRSRHRKKNELKLIGRQCVECGKPFKTWYPKQVFCSQVCSKKSAHRKRRQIERARIHSVTYIERVSLKKLFIRDGGKCQICGIRVVMAKKHKVNRATHDHIIPISVGGENSYRNAQLACWQCNTGKGNGTVESGEQLRLFG